MKAHIQPAKEIQLRFGVVLFVELVTFFYLPRMAVWRGMEREVWQFFLVGSGAALCLVLLVPILLHGSNVERLWSALLAGLPLLILYGVGCEILSIPARGY